VAAPIAAATAVSAVAHSGLYEEVVRSTWTGCLLMLVRNGLPATAAGLSFARLWRSGRSMIATDRAKSDGITRNPHAMPAVFPDETLSTS